MAQDKYLLSSVSKTMQILDLLGEQEQIGLNEICAKLDLNKTSAFRYLHTLEAGGYVYKTSDAKYMLGKKFVYMASIVEERQTDLSLARPILSRLRDKINETIHLSILLPDLNVMFVEKLSSTQTLQMRSRVGYQIPAYQSGSGKVLLAGFLGTDRESALSDISYEPKTALTITNEADLRAQLERIREQGFGEENGEAEEGLSCLAVPVHDYLGDTVAAISISGPTDRLQEHRGEYLKELLNAQGEVERDLAL